MGLFNFFKDIKANLKNSELFGEPSFFLKNVTNKLKEETRSYRILTENKGRLKIQCDIDNHTVTFEFIYFANHLQVTINILTSSSRRNVYECAYDNEEIENLVMSFVDGLQSTAGNIDEARIIESNKGLDLSISPKLLTNGFYEFKFNGNKNGQTLSITELLTFGENNKVFRYQANRVLQLNKIQIQQIFNAAIKIFDNDELDKNVSTYSLDGDDIDMKFYSDPAKTDLFSRLEGTVINKGLILDISVTYFNYELMKINTEVFVKNAEFTFISAT